MQNFLPTEIVLNALKKQEMCNDMVRNGPYLFESVLDSLKNQKICEDAVEKKKKLLGTCLWQLHDPRNLGTRLREKTKLVNFVREHLQTQEMCAEALIERAAIVTRDLRQS